MTDYKQFNDINELVRHLQNQYDIDILCIRDYGSKAWNLDSENSDMDAGMVYTQNPLNYVQLGGYTENIDRKFMLDGEEFELIGWNIKRFAELLNKSNPSMIEWLNSDIQYYNDKLFIGSRVKAGEDVGNLFDELKEHANNEFKPISLFYHYRSMAKSNFTKYIENRNDISIKRHLYILRGLTYARYVEKTHEMPPLDYTKFYEEQLPELVEDGTIPETVYKYIGTFIEQKKNGEGSNQLADEELWNWISNELDHKLDNDEHDVRGIDREKINNLISKVVL